MSGAICLLCARVALPKGEIKADFHERRHGNQHWHRILEPKKDEERAAPNSVTAPVNSQFVNWINEYYRGTGTAPTNPPAPDSSASSANASGDDAPTTAATTTTTISSIPPVNARPDQCGRTGSYNAENSSLDRITFLNHFGGQNLGDFDCYVLLGP